MDRPKSLSHTSVSFVGHSRRERLRYRPAAHRTAFFVCLGIVVLILIAALEYSAHVLPQVPSNLNLPSQVSHSTSKFKRQDDGMSNDPDNGDDNNGDDNDPSDDPNNDDPISDGTTTTTTTSASASISDNASASLAGGALTTSVPIATTSPAYGSGGAATTLVVPISVSSSANPASTPTELPNTSAVQISVIPAHGTTPATVVTVPATRASASSSSVAVAAVTTITYVVAPTSAPTASAGTQIPEYILNGTLLSSLPLVLVDYPQNYFLGIYAPILIAVVLRLCMSYLYRCTKLLDPFHMLSQDEGAPLKNFFTADHLGSESLFAPFKTLVTRRWSLLWTSVLYAATQLLTPFASELMEIHPSTYAFEDDASQTFHIVRGRSLWVNPVIIRIIQGLLAFIFIQIINVWWLLRKEPSELTSNPASIATIASLVGNPDTAWDFSTINQCMDSKAVMEAHGDRRYRLQSYIAPDGSECQGIVPFYDTYHQNHIPIGSKELLSSSDSRKASPSSIARKDSIYLAMITAGSLTLLVIVLYYALVDADSSFERFMDSQTFGPRFLLATLALLLKSPLLSLWCRTLASVPFARLAARPRSAKLDILRPVPVPQTPLGSIAYTLRRRAWFAASLAIVAGIMVEVLLILLPGVPFEAEQDYVAARISWFAGVGCLGLILLVAIAGWIRLFVKRPKWPQVPNTVGVVAMYVSGSMMATDCAAEDYVIPNGARFDFRERRGRWVVEYQDIPDEPIRDSYYSAGTDQSGYPEHLIHRGASLRS